MRTPLLVVLVLLAAPGSVVAQDVPADWSRVIVARWCHPDHPCTLRMGLVWNDSNPIPRYPPVMADVGISGQVLVHFTVRPDGSVDSASVSVSGVTNRAFEHFTLESARQWRFGTEAPDRPAGPIAATMRVVYAVPVTCRGARAPTPGGAVWAPDGKSMQLIVIAGCRPLVPRDQVRPPSGPGE